MSEDTRTKRFAEFTTTATGRGETLNRFVELFARSNVPLNPDVFDLYEALLIAGIDADFVLEATQRIVQEADENGGILRKYGLSFCEAQCIAMYTVEVPKEKGKSPYQVINETLCGRRDEKSLTRVRRLMLFLLHSLRKLPRVSKNVVYRGITMEDKNQLLGEGGREETMTFWGFTSTTTNMAITNTFSSGSSGTLLVLEGPVIGYDIHEFSQYPRESEILLEPETLVEISGTGIGNAVVQCKVKPTGTILQNQSFVVAEAEGALEKMDLVQFAGVISSDSFYQRVTGKRNGDAMTNLGRCLFKGVGTPKNIKRAVELYERGVAPAPAASAGVGFDFITQAPAATPVPKVVILPAEKGDGMELSAAFVKDGGRMYMELTCTNRGGMPLGDFAMQYNKNAYGLTPESAPALGVVNPGQSADARVPIIQQPAMVKPADRGVNPDIIQIAMKNSTGKIYFFTGTLPAGFASA